mgnify:CR=1 FL=1
MGMVYRAAHWVPTLLASGGLEGASATVTYVAVGAASAPLTEADPAVIRPLAAEARRS